MMKKSFFAALCACLLMSCSNDIQETSAIPQEDEGSVKLTFNLFDIEQTPFTRTGIADMTTVTHLSVTVFKAPATDGGNPGDEVKKTTQKKGDTDYGTISFKLPSGKYVIEAVAYKDDASTDVISFTSAVAFSAPSTLKDMFSGNKAITIEKNETQTLVIDMHRAVSYFALKSNNTAPDEIKSVDIIFSKGSSSAFNPYTGFATTDTGHTRTYSSNLGATFSAYSFLASASETMDITVQAKNEGGTVIYSHDFKDIPLQINHKTTVSGPFFSAATSSSFNFVDTWVEDEYITFE